MSGSLSGGSKSRVRRLRAQESLTGQLAGLYGGDNLEASSAFLELDLAALTKAAPDRRPSVCSPDHPHSSAASAAAEGTGTAIEADLSALPWALLRRVEEAGADSGRHTSGGAAVTVNSGGAVYFLRFTRGSAVLKVCAPRMQPPSRRSSPSLGLSSRRLLIQHISFVRFQVCATPVAAQSEFFATQCCGPLGVRVPRTRLLRCSHAEEWQAKLEAAHGALPTRCTF